MWNGSNFGGINAINVDAKKVWRPDIFLYNKWVFDPTVRLEGSDRKSDADERLES